MLSKCEISDFTSTARWACI